MQGVRHLITHLIALPSGSIRAPSAQAAASPGHGMGTVCPLRSSRRSGRRGNFKQTSKRLPPRKRGWSYIGVVVEGELLAAEAN